jgi:hypothetical protein
LELFKEPGDAQPVGNLFFFSVEINFHENAKTAFTRATSRWPGNTVLSSSRAECLNHATCGTSTLTLPYAGATRIRFEGLPVLCQALSLPQADTPSILRSLNRAPEASQITGQLGGGFGGEKL